MHVLVIDIYSPKDLYSSHEITDVNGSVLEVYNYKHYFNLFVIIFLLVILC